MQSRHRGRLVLTLFFCSGMTALVYEVVWSKFLSQMLGSTIYAQTVVLAAFMGGLALGNRLFGAWADQWRRPVRAYGCLEIAIAVYALFFPAVGPARRSRLRRHWHPDCRTHPAFARAERRVERGSVAGTHHADGRHLMSSGVFRVWEPAFEPRTMPLRKQHTKILFYEDAPDATVSVETGDGIIFPANLTLRINGKADASIRSDLSTQLLLAHLPMLAKPRAKDVFVLGLGSGVTAGALLSYPVEHIAVAENCEPVVRAAKFFADWNRHVLDDPRARVWREDGRAALKLHPQLYDVIITEPSNPWMVGVGSVFSREYYELAASRLKPGGLMAQWFHVYDMQDDILELVLRTYSSVFSYIEIWDTSGGDIVMLGSLPAVAHRAGSVPAGFRVGTRADGSGHDQYSFPRGAAGAATGVATNRLRHRRRRSGPKRSFPRAGIRRAAGILPRRPGASIEPV